MNTDLKRIAIIICQACLDGKGSECHTPGCALFLHRVDLPIDPNAYEVLENLPALGLLRKCEFISTQNHHGDAQCPICGGSAPGSFRLPTDPPNGHTPDCELAALLGANPHPVELTET